MCKSTLICFLFVAFAITVEVTSVTFYDSFEDAQTWKSSAFLGIGLVLFMFYLWVTCSLLQFITSKPAEVVEILDDDIKNLKVMLFYMCLSLLGFNTFKILELSDVIKSDNGLGNTLAYQIQILVV